MRSLPHGGASHREHPPSPDGARAGGGPHEDFSKFDPGLRVEVLRERHPLAAELSIEFDEFRAARTTAPEDWLALCFWRSSLCFESRHIGVRASHLVEPAPFLNSSISGCGRRLWRSSIRF